MFERVSHRQFFGKSERRPTRESALRRCSSVNWQAPTASPACPENHPLVLPRTFPQSNPSDGIVGSSPPADPALSKATSRQKGPKPLSPAHIFQAQRKTYYPEAQTLPLSCVSAGSSQKTPPLAANHYRSKSKVFEPPAVTVAFRPEVRVFAYFFGRRFSSGRSTAPMITEASFESLRLTRPKQSDSDNIHHYAKITTYTLMPSNQQIEGAGKTLSEGQPCGVPFLIGCRRWLPPPITPYVPHPPQQVCERARTPY